jgi:hypothetical protein
VIVVYCIVVVKVKTIEDGYDFAAKNIRSGKVWEHFYNFINCNKGNT